MENNTIDHAIELCNENIKKHSIRSTVMLTTLLLVIASFFGLNWFIVKNDANNIKAADKVQEQFDQLNNSFSKSSEEFAYLHSYYSKTVTDSITKRFDQFLNAHFDNKIYQYIRKDSTLDNTIFRPNYKFDPKFEFEIRRNVSAAMLNDSTLINDLKSLKVAIEPYLENNNQYISKNYVYLLYAVFILLIGIVTSFYRFHLKEVSKNEQYRIGFQRIRIAGNNSSTKYDDYVKYYLSKDAFLFGNKPSKEMIESPLPGHPSSDIATFGINKIVEEIVSRSKNSNSGNEKS